MIWLIVNDADVQTAKDIYQLDRVLIMDTANLKEGEAKFTEKIKSIKSPRIMFTHLPYR